MERRHYIPSYEALSVEVGIMSRCVEVWSGYLVKSSYLCVLLLEYLCVLCPTSLSPLGI